MTPKTEETYTFKYVRLELCPSLGYRAVNRSVDLKYVRTSGNAYVFIDKWKKEIRIDKSIFLTSCTLKAN